MMEGLLMNIEKENKTAIISLTKNGAKIGRKLLDNLDATLYLPERLKKDSDDGIIYFSNFKEVVEKKFKKYPNLIFVMATGVVVRSIALLLHNKREDPAIVVLDEKAKHVISLLSGHLGGANELTVKVAKLLDSDPVITTATDVNEKPALDMLAKELNCVVKPLEKIKLFNRYLVEGEDVVIYTSWKEELAKLLKDKDITIKDMLKLKERGSEEEVVILSNKCFAGITTEHIHLYPKNLVVGIGCRKGVSSYAISNCIKEVFEKNNLALESIKMLTSIELKKDEPGINEVARELNVPFQTVSEEDILGVEDDFEESDFVKKITGVGGVCQPAAKIMSKNGKIIVPKQKLEKITISVAEEKFM